MPLDQSQIEEAAAYLFHLQVQRQTAAGLPAEIAPRTVEDAYAIQEKLHTTAGWPTPVLKVGCTSQLAQDLLSIPHPIAGRIPADGVFGDGAQVPRSMFASSPQIECELAVRVDAAGGVDAVAPAMELVGPRLVSGAAFAGLGVIADNSAGAAVVLGPALDSAGVELKTASVELFADDVSAAAGVATDVMGGPKASLRWLTEHETSRGRSIEPGTWIITGTFTGVTPTAVGGSYRADFGPLGSVSFRLI